MTEKFVYPLAEVAELTGWSELSLLRDCRAGRIEHVHRGNAYGLTADQIAQLIARHSVTPVEEPSGEQAALEAVRRASLRIKSRR